MHTISTLLREMAGSYENNCLSTIEGMSATVWEEGGEWLSILHPVYVERAIVRSIELEFQTVSSVGHVLTLVEQGAVNALMMRCGTGKSTVLAGAIHDMKMCAVTFVVVPSLVTARALSEYVAKNVRAAGTLNDCIVSTGLYYVSAAQVLTWAVAGNSFEDVLFVIDEAHCVTPVYRALREWLATTESKAVFMTASLGAGLFTSNAECRVAEIQRADNALKDKYVDHFSSGGALVVGVEDGNVYASPANLLVGNTVALSLVIDTGLRPDPVYVEGRIGFGERVAQSTEVAQMTGRVGRGDARGFALAVKGARSVASLKPRFYDCVFEMYLGLLGMRGREKFDEAVGFLREITGKEAIISSIREDPLEEEVRTLIVPVQENVVHVKRLSLVEASRNGLVVRQNAMLHLVCEVEDPLKLTNVDLNGARLVLSKARLPSFHELEVAAVMRLWKDLARVLDSHVPEEYTEQFESYFSMFKRYVNGDGAMCGIFVE